MLLRSGTELSGTALLVERPGVDDRSRGPVATNYDQEVGGHRRLASLNGACGLGVRGLQICWLFHANASIVTRRPLWSSIKVISLFAGLVKRPALASPRGCQRGHPQACRRYL